MYVTHRFHLPQAFKVYLLSQKPSFGFGLFSEVVFYRSYSRIKENGQNESWADVVIRVTEGVFSIRKDYYIKHGLFWDEAYWSKFAIEFAKNMFALKWLPPGRGLWIMGTEYIYERGSAALYNCAAVDTTDLSSAANWAMDMLMVGAGVGFNTAWDGKAYKPDKKNYKTYIIEDSKEGWVKSLRLLLDSYTKKTPFYRFDYSKIRPAGTPLKTFGGVAAGAEPLKKLHQAIETILDSYLEHQIDKTRAIVDIFNEIGLCVVSGNIRRSAEIAIGKPNDTTFLNLKNYKLYPEREKIGWISNNSVLLDNIEDFSYIDSLVPYIYENGEPGILHLENMQKYGRFGEIREDRAWLSNPCGEIALESYELCNLAEVFVSKCKNKEEFLQMLHFATFYAATVNLLPTHRHKTNSVVARNRRTGVSVSGVADAIEKMGVEKLMQWLRDGYKLVRECNRKLAKDAGIPVSLKVTAVKPSGTISLLAGTSPGMHYPPFTYAIRRIRIAKSSKLNDLLQRAGIPYEEDIYDNSTYVYEFPLHYDNPKSIDDVSLWEQMSILAMLQREWSDNMVSNTIEFDKDTHSPKDLANAIKLFLPMLKSTTLLPKDKNIYPQMPFEKITKEEYEKRLEAIKAIEWENLSQHHANGDRYCSARRCTLF